MSQRSDTERLVQQRASARCEYCLMHQSLQGATFHIEHIFPQSRGGASHPENLAWACPGCNLRKSDKIEVVLPEESQPVPLFNPRRDRWGDHFEWQGHQLVGLTPIGQATVQVLVLNHERRLKIRQAESLFGLFPPDAEQTTRVTGLPLG